MEWIAFFVGGIIEQCDETIAFTQTILSLRQLLRAEIGHVRRRAALLAVLDVFFQQPVCTLRQISEEAQMAVNSAQAAVDELQERGLVYELTGRQKGRVYACRPVLDAVFGRTTPAEDGREERQ